MFEFAAFDFSAALLALAALAGFALLGWLVSLRLDDVSIVDSMWSLMFLLSLGVYVFALEQSGWRTWLILALTAIWALRLSGHIAWRSRGELEDRRYRKIRANNQPNFRIKSLYIVFGLQALLAWIISFPLLAAASHHSGPGWLDAIGLVLWCSGMFFEVVGDAQLARFKRNPDNRGKVLDSGLWRYTRHPNYFGEFLLQWGFFFFAMAAGGSWTIFAPLLISFLLLRVSGVTLLEKDIEERRPAYREYVKRTNAFFPGRPKPGPGYALFILVALSLAGCAGRQAPLPTVDYVELERFMGDWYVIAHIPTFLEDEAYNAVESYSLEPDGTIATTFTFREGGFEGDRKRYTPTGFVLDKESNAVWGMRFVWPIKADYRIIYLDEDYSLTVVGRNKRDFVWIMAREPEIDQGRYANALEVVEEAGYDLSGMRAVPQQW